MPEKSYRESVRETMRAFSDEALAFQSSVIVGGIDRQECDLEIRRRAARARPRPDFDPRIDYPERYTDGPV